MYLEEFYMFGQMKEQPETRSPYGVPPLMQRCGESPMRQMRVAAGPEMTDSYMLPGPT